MKPLRLALFIILLIFHAILVILSLNFSSSIADSVVRNPAAFRFYAIFGLAVLLVTFAFAWFDRRTARKRIERLEAEKNAIKVDIFDREQRVEAREREIEGEIRSFQQSLPTPESTTTTTVPDPDESYDDESDDTQLYSTEPRFVESHPVEPSAIQSGVTHSEQDDDDPVEYAPLKPKRSASSTDAPSDEPGSDEPDSDEPGLDEPGLDESSSEKPDTNPFRS